MAEAEAVAAAQRRAKGRPKGTKDSVPRRRPPLTFRASDITRALKMAEKAGWQQVRLDKSGDIVLVRQAPKEPASQPGGNPWDEVYQDED